MRPYTLMPKYFYDDLGSALFEAITLSARVLPHARRTRSARDVRHADRRGVRRTARAGRTRQRQRDEDALDHRCDSRTSGYADVPSDRHLARRADRIVASARCEARSAARARVCRRLLHALAREAHRDARARARPLSRFEHRQFRTGAGARTLRLARRDARAGRRPLDRLRSEKRSVDSGTRRTTIRPA